MFIFYLGKGGKTATNNLPPFPPTHSNLTASQINHVISQTQNSNLQSLLHRLAMTSQMPNMAHYIQKSFEQSSNAGEFLQNIAPVLGPVLPPVPPMNNGQGQPTMPGPEPSNMQGLPTPNRFNSFNFQPVPGTNQTVRPPVAPINNGQVPGPQMIPIRPPCLVNPFNGPPAPITIQSMIQGPMIANQNIPGKNNPFAPNFAPQPNMRPRLSMPLNQMVSIPVRGPVPGSSSMQQIPAQGFVPGPPNFQPVPTMHQGPVLVPSNTQQIPSPAQGFVPGPSNTQQMPPNAHGFIPGPSNIQRVPAHRPVDKLLLNGQQQRMALPRQRDQGMRQPQQRMLVGEAVRVPTKVSQRMIKQSPFEFSNRKAPDSERSLARDVNEREKLIKQRQSTSPTDSRERMTNLSVPGNTLVKERSVISNVSNSDPIDLTGTEPQSTFEVSISNFYLVT